MFIYPEDIDYILYDKVSSTNTIAKKMIINSKLQEGVVVIAEEQTNGYGRSGNEWISSKGNLHASIIFAPKNLSISELQKLVFVFSIAIRESIYQFDMSGKNNLLFKWPNDLLCNDKKVAGMVIESSINVRNATVDWFVLGMGVNIVSHPKLIFPDNFSTTSLHDENIKNISSNELVARIMKNIKTWGNRYNTQGFDFIKDYWLNRCYKKDEIITLKLPEGNITGIFKTINNLGEILIEDEFGSIRNIAIGNFFPAQVSH